MLDATVNQIKAKLDNNEILLFISQNGKNTKKHLITNVGKGEKKEKLSETATRNINWYRCF